ncbi:MAG: hypothetical protein V1895_02780 [Parcubacteria group bacterium]
MAKPSQEKSRRLSRRDPQTVPDVGGETIKVSRGGLEVKEQAVKEEAERTGDLETQKLGEAAREAGRQKKALETSPEQISTQRAAVKAAYQEVGPLTPERLLPREAEPTEPKAEERERLPGVPSEFSKDQLEFALRQSIALGETIHRGDFRGLERLLREFKIIFPVNVATEHRDLLEKNLGLTQINLEFAPKMYQSENPSIVGKLLGPSQRLELLTENMPFLVMRYEPRQGISSEAALNVRVQKLLPELEHLVLDGGARAKDFESELIGLGERGKVAIARIKQAEQARTLLAKEEWTRFSEALSVLTRDYPDATEQLEMSDAHKAFLSLPEQVSRLRLNPDEAEMNIEIVKLQVASQLKPWLRRLAPEQRQATSKYLETALDLYAGTLSQK